MGDTNHLPRLASGAMVGSYRIDRLIGLGGMGEVYRARDTTLARDVALKNLPESFALDPDRLDALENDTSGPTVAAAADLAGGRTGLAVFFSYLARTHGDTPSRIATALLDQAISVVGNTVMSPSLHEGFTGIAWACAPSRRAMKRRIPTQTSTRR